MESEYEKRDAKRVNSGAFFENIILELIVYLRGPTLCDGGLYIF